MLLCDLVQDPLVQYGISDETRFQVNSGLPPPHT